MAIERFERIVEAAKEQEIEINQLIADLKRETERRLKAEKQLDLHGQVVAELRDTEIPVIRRPGLDGKRPEGLEYHKNSDLPIGLTRRASDPDRIVAQISFVDPKTGRSTTKQAVRDAFIEAVIARNEIAAALLRRGLIDLERFVKFTSL